MRSSGFSSGRGRARGADTQPFRFSKGTTVARYRIDEPLFHTPLCELYEVSDAQGTAPRTLMCRLMNDTPFEEPIFHEELTRLQGLRLKHAPLVVDGGVSGKLLWISMESIADTEPFWEPPAKLRSVLEVLTFGATFGETFGEASKAGVHHGDLTPSCLRERKDGSPVFVGLGSARLFGLDAETIQRSPHFRAPEQIQHRVVDDQTDMYAFGLWMHAAMGGPEAEEAARREFFKRNN